MDTVNVDLREKGLSGEMTHTGARRKKKKIDQSKLEQCGRVNASPWTR